MIGLVIGQRHRYTHACGCTCTCTRVIWCDAAGAEEGKPQRARVVCSLGLPDWWWIIHGGPEEDDAAAVERRSPDVNGHPFLSPGRFSSQIKGPAGRPSVRFSILACWPRRCPFPACLGQTWHATSSYFSDLHACTFHFQMMVVNWRRASFFIYIIIFSADQNISDH